MRSSFRFQMNKKESVICEFEMDFKKSSRCSFNKYLTEIKFLYLAR